MVKIPVYFDQPIDTRSVDSTPQAAKLQWKKIQLDGNVDAGEEVFGTVGYGKKIWIDTIILTVSTSPIASTRIPSLYLQLSSGGNFIDMYLYPSNMTATSAVYTAIWDHSGAVGSAFHTEYLKLPDVVLAETNRLRVQWVGDLAGDTLECMILYRIVS